MELKKLQINRLFEIIYLLLEKKTLTARELAELFEVSPRTIYRDVETLSQAGIPIYMSKGKGGGISLLPDYILNKAVLSDEEKTDILYSMEAVNAVSLENKSSALNKLNSMLGKNENDWIEVDFSSWGIFQNDGEYFSRLKTAITQKKVIAFMYSSAKAEKIKRTALPLKLVFKGSAWYLYGYCRIRKDFRFFKIRRISELIVTDEVFQLSPPKKVINNHKTDMDTFIKAILKISPEMAFRVYDEINSYTIDADNNFICELYLPNIDTVCDYAASFGQYCTILSPVGAAKKMKERLEKTLKNYI